MDALIEPVAWRVSKTLGARESEVLETAPAVVQPPAERAVAAAAADAAVASPEILRFRRSEIMVHWMIAVPFMTCFTSGFVLKLFFNLDASVTRAFLSWIHKTSGGCLVALPLFAVLWHREDLGLHLDNVRKAWTWSRDDVRWLVLSALAAAGRKVTLPEQPKFNAGERINFMILTCTYPLFALTGILVWMPGIPIASWIVHVTVAAAVGPVMLGHIFMATVNDDTRPGLSGMVSGRVDRSWAKHHYRLWYREHHEATEGAASAAGSVRRVESVAAAVRCTACAAEYETSWPGVIETVEELKPLRCPACGEAAEVVSVVAPADSVEALLRDLDQARVRGASAGPTLAAS